MQDATSLRNIQTCARTEEPGPLAGGGPALDTHQPGDLEIQESRFLSQQDWGPQRTSEEMKRLQNVCVRLRKALSNTQADNLALGEKLRNLPSYLYEKLKEEMQAGRRK
ncbi:hypothetical protein H920_10287 [Fukomys damarensis]|uniref:Uncharacterized protein n=1 Tax=Fukomys damarensis TaxID=885580 RepID=A0A091E020_FUKDA|nr:hypothetical protein H920_10287 [Fukomys damarensis]